jgi:hypothetical protein
MAEELIIIAPAPPQKPYLLGGWDRDDSADRLEISPEAVTMLVAMELAKSFPSIDSYISWLFREEASGKAVFAKAGK